MGANLFWLVCFWLLCVVSAHAETTLTWRQLGTAHYVCGGVSEENMARVKSMSDQADVELLFTTGPKGAYLADVTVTIRSDALGSVMFVADGPLCLLQLPKGPHTVSAEYRGHKLKQTVDVGEGLAHAKFNWPAP